MTQKMIQRMKKRPRKMIRTKIRKTRIRMIRKTRALMKKLMTRKKMMIKTPWKKSNLMTRKTRKRKILSQSPKRKPNGHPS